MVRGVRACNPVVKDEYPSFASTRSERGKPAVPVSVALHGASLASRHPHRAERPAFSSGAARDGHRSGTPGAARRLALRRAPSFGSAPAFASSARERLATSAGFGVPSVDATPERLPPNLAVLRRRCRFVSSSNCFAPGLDASDPWRPQPPASVRRRTPTVDFCQSTRNPSTPASDSLPRGNGLTPSLPWPSKACGRRLEPKPEPPAVALCPSLRMAAPRPVRTADEHLSSRRASQAALGDVPRAKARAETACGPPRERANHR